MFSLTALLDVVFQNAQEGKRSKVIKVILTFEFFVTDTKKKIVKNTK